MSGAGVPRRTAGPPGASVRYGSQLRRGVTALELLLASGLLLLVMVFLWSALHLASRSAGKAEWIAFQEREPESFRHVLAEELRRANHLITMDATGYRVHDPLFSAVWILEDGRGVGFRVFESDQRVADPVRLPLEELRQDRVHFVLRDRELVYLRKGQLESDRIEVLLPLVTSLTFRAGSSYEQTGALAGTLEVELEILDPEGASRITRHWSLPTSVPVLRQGAAPPGEDFLPAPAPGSGPDAAAP